VTGTVTKKRPAEIDLLNHFLFIGEDNLDAAERFLAAAEDAITKLADMPGMGALRDFKNSELVGLRSWPIKGFESYLVFYMPTPTGIDVLRVLHGARDLERLFASE
jgi:toxin ParE1/3/4